MGRIRTKKKYLAYFKHYEDKDGQEGYEVTFPDLPEITANGSTFDEAALYAGLFMYHYLTRYYVDHGDYPKKMYWRHRPPEPEDVFSVYIIKTITPRDIELAAQSKAQDLAHEEAERIRLAEIEKKRRNPWR